MKLLTKTSLYYLISSIFVFAIGGFIFYQLIISEIFGELDALLLKQKVKIISHIDHSNTLPDLDIIYEIKVKIVPIPQYKPINITKDTLLFDDLEESNIHHRVLIFTYKVKDQPYQFFLFKSFFELRDLVKGIATFVLILLGASILVMVSVNIIISRRTFKPFYTLLQKLEDYDITKSKPLELKPTNIYEFTKLNKVILAMTNKSRKDYLIQKEYIEHASHEIQTPLAIIRSKCELILQSSYIPENELNSLSAIIDSADRLSKLNHALLLISKIENMQFSASEPINLQQSIEKHLTLFEDLISMKEIEVKTYFVESPVLLMNPVLLDILISNLLSNSIKHNIPGGSINIKLTNHKLVIENSGAPLSVNSDDLFKRFFKNNSKTESLGLGLTIVKRIIDFYHMDVSYINDINHHQVDTSHHILSVFLSK